MATGRLFIAVSIVLFVVAAVVAAGTKVLTGADVWAYAGLAFFAAGHLV